MHTVLDLTHTITGEMQVFPGTEPPVITPANTIAADGFRETRLNIYSHVGTHMDAPAHMLANAKTLDALDVSRFVGKAAVIPCSGSITMKEIDAFCDIADKADFLIFQTGQDALWGQKDYFNAPVPSAEVIGYAITSGKKGIGIDCMSVDPIEGEMPNHMRLFAAGMVIIENLCGLGEISGRLVDFAALPLKYIDADGAPVRAIAVFDR